MTDVTDALRTGLLSAWDRSDRILGMLHPDALHARPIPLRHPFVFYLGHLPAFAWNQIGKGVLQRPPRHAGFDELFERGIDPPDTGDGAPAQDPPARWPDIDAILSYRDGVRQAVLASLPELAGRAPRDTMARHGRVVHAVVEHELMHHETLLYMLSALEPSRWRPPDADPPLAGAGRTRRPVGVPAGRVTLGARSDDRQFGWDNEFPEHSTDVEAFPIDDLPVTVGEFLAFVEAGGYERPELWSESGRAWLAARRPRHPHGWRRDAGGWRVARVHGEAPLEALAELPASVTWVEADAFARWEGRRLPTEAEFHRAAYGTPEGRANAMPWGDAEVDARRANVGFARWSAAPVGSHPEGRSAFGVHELVGNGWEWTGTPFGPFPGFEASMPGYPGYSADFFDGRHYVLLGGSWATDRKLVRRPFRNWYQPHYPYPFTKFRCVGASRGGGAG
jgi:ergothioneine biosynthesis protein EgtB